MFYSTSEVVKRTTFSLSQILRESEAQRFPRAVKLGRKKAGYPRQEVDAWLADKLGERSA